MKVIDESLAPRLKSPALFLVLLLGSAACFAVGFLVARFIGGSQNPIQLHALGAEALVSLVLGLPYAVVGLCAGFSGKNWRVFYSVFIAHMIFFGALTAQSLATGIKMGAPSLIVGLAGLGLAQAALAEYSYRWINRLWNNA